MCDPIPPAWVATFSGPLNGGTITVHTPNCLALARVRQAATRPAGPS